MTKTIRGVLKWLFGFSGPARQARRQPRVEHPVQLRAPPERVGRAVHGRRRHEEVHRDHHQLGLQVRRWDSG